MLGQQPSDLANIWKHLNKFLEKSQDLHLRNFRPKSLTRKKTALFYTKKYDGYLFLRRICVINLGWKPPSLFLWPASSLSFCSKAPLTFNFSPFLGGNHHCHTCQPPSILAEATLLWFVWEMFTKEIFLSNRDFDFMVMNPMVGRKDQQSPHKNVQVSSRIFKWCILHHISSTKDDEICCHSLHSNVWILFA